MKKLVLIHSLVLAVQAAAATHHGPHASESPGGVRSLDLYLEGGRLHLLTVDYDPTGKPVVYYASSADGGKSFAKRVRADLGNRPISLASRGNDIPLVAHGGRLAALWPTKGTGYMGSGPVEVAVSEDAGKTWRRGRTPADDGTTIGHRYLAAAADEAGAFHAVWLDNRTGAQALYYARSEDGGKGWSPNVVIDPKTCECCWNRIAAAPGGRLYVLYRAAKPRDMALAVSADGGKTWSRRAGIGGFGWDINICPHAGGGLALATTQGRTRVHALVYNGKEGSEGLYYLSSDDDGRAWGHRRKLAGAGARHADLAISPDGKRLAAVWGAAGRIHVSISGDAGESWSDPRPLTETGGSRATHPRVVAVAGDFRVYWTEQPERKPSRLKSRRI